MVGTTNIGLTYKPADVSEEGTIVLRSCNIINGKIDLEDLVRVKTDIRDNQYIEENDILICARNGSRSLVGKCAVMNNIGEKTSFGAFMAVFRSICYRYVYHYFNTLLFRSAFDNDDSKQINQVTQAILQDTMIPLPPFAEQERIVSTLDETFALVDLINEETENIEFLIKSTKAHILDLAIRGKLVPQTPDDEPASVLLERIRAEKEELIKQGKIKRDKKESVIFKGEDNSYYLNDGSTDINITSELPFNIPASWRWAQINNVLIVNPRNKLYDELEVSFVPMPLINDGYSGKHTAEVRKWKDIKTGFTHFSEGDVGVAKISPCFENLKSTVFENLSNGYGAGTTELYILRPYKDTILARYLLMYIKSDYFIRNGKQTCTGDVGQQRVRKDYVESAYFPIPPLNEQHRIVEAIETAFSQLDAIAESLN